LKYYAVIDTNVLVSAMLKWESIPGKVMELAFSDSIIPVYCQSVLDEYREVLSRPKFGLNEQLVSDIINTFIEKGICTETDEFSIELPDPKDVVFYQVVMEKRKDDDAYLVTGNIKHFPEETFVVTPRQMLELVGLL